MNLPLHNTKFDHVVDRDNKIIAAAASHEYADFIVEACNVHAILVSDLRAIWREIQDYDFDGKYAEIYRIAGKYAG